MHDRADVVAIERGADRGDVRDVAFDELAVLHRFAVAGDQVVEDDDAVAGARQRLGRVAADVAGASGHQHRARLTGQWRNS